MTVLDTIAKQAGRFATDVQTSLKRARVEGERRLLQRQHRAALEELGERTYELVRSGEMEEGRLGPEIAAVESKLMEIEAKVAETEALREEEEEEGLARSEEDPLHAAFPMVEDDGAERSPGPGWEAAGRFFRSGS
jgi:hypothetical protein